MSIEKPISSNLRRIRKSKGIQRRLAERSGVDVRQISQYENKPSHVSTATLERLVDGLGVPVSSLVDTVRAKGDDQLPKAMEPGLKEAIRILRTQLGRIKK